jgi:NDP-sugar pyrophosphorylase family protein/aminoglycoside/choline kinase family phosphotransferase
MISPRAFILCAGLGTRLRPLTHHIAKPLLPILGRPLLELVLERVAAAVDGPIGINLHWKAPEVEAWIRGTPYADRITLFHENPILGTGGALKNAEVFLRDGPFLVHNVDVLSDIDLSGLMASHTGSGALATLAVHDHPEFNTVGVSADGVFLGLADHAPAGGRLMAFTGIAAYSPEFLDVLPDGISRVTHAWEKARNRGLRIAAADVTGCTWMDLGTPVSYARAAFLALDAQGERVFIHPGARAEGLHSEGRLIVEASATVSPDVELKDSVVLPGARITASGESLILGDGFAVPVPQTAPAQALTHPLLEKGTAEGILVGIGGSDRTYYRVETDSGSRILMICPDADPHYATHMEAHALLSRHAFPVPALYARHDASRAALFEDLGDDRLYDWLKFNRHPDAVEGMYRKVLRVVARLHREITPHAEDLPLLGARRFDFDHLRWETGYFLERFVRGVLNRDCSGDAALKQELDRLARRAAAYSKVILHRDLQSQNIMIPRDGNPRFVDYQGIRLGPPAHDIASLLWDPYAPLPEEMRTRLLRFYVEESGFPPEEFLVTLIPCRLQRHMQALGAYGFLAKVKGKGHFFKYVPEALWMLREETEMAQEEYPALYELVKGL